jgi:hypothetical protein
MWMYDFFNAQLLLEQHQSEQAFYALQRLATTFPTSSYVMVSDLSAAPYHATPWPHDGV